jgi:uncharacterized protein YjeT (DUF2065 family)
MLNTLLLAFALMLVIEGLAALSCAQRVAGNLSSRHRMSDGQIRFIGLSSMLVGVVLLTVFR